MLTRMNVSVTRCVKTASFPCNSAPCPLFNPPHVFPFPFLWTHRRTPSSFFPSSEPHLSFLPTCPWVTTQVPSLFLLYFLLKSAEAKLTLRFCKHRLLCWRQTRVNTRNLAPRGFLSQDLPPVPSPYVQKTGDVLFPGIFIAFPTVYHAPPSGWDVFPPSHHPEFNGMLPCKPPWQP